MSVFIVTLVFKTVIYISKLLVINTSQASKANILNQTPTLWTDTNSLRNCFLSLIRLLFNKFIYHQKRHPSELVNNEINLSLSYLASDKMFLHLHKNKYQLYWLLCTKSIIKVL